MLTNVTNQDCKNPKIPKVYSCKSSTAGNDDSQLTGKFGGIRSSAERQMWCMAGRACAISIVSPPLWSNKDEHPQLQSCSYLSWVFPIALIIATIRREMLFWRALESRKLNLYRTETTTKKCKTEKVKSKNAFLYNSQPKIGKSVETFTHVHKTPIQQKILPVIRRATRIVGWIWHAGRVNSSPTVRRSNK